MVKRVKLYVLISRLINILQVIKSSNEAAIICNILSMTFLQKGNYCLNNILK